MLTPRALAPLDYFGKVSQTLKARRLLSARAANMMLCFSLPIRGFFNVMLLPAFPAAPCATEPVLTGWRNLTASPSGRCFVQRSRVQAEEIVPLGEAHRAPFNHHLCRSHELGRYFPKTSAPGGTAGDRHFSRARRRVEPQGTDTFQGRVEKRAQSAGGGTARASAGDRHLGETLPQFLELVRGQTLLRFYPFWMELYCTASAHVCRMRSCWCSLARNRMCISGAIGSASFPNR